MSYNAIICKLENVRPHPNGQFIQIAGCCGYQVIVGLDSKDGDFGIFFSEDGQLSVEYANANNLIGYIDDVTGERKGGYFGKNRKVKTQRFRGEKSEGYFAPLTSLTFTNYDISTLKLGDKFDKLNNIPICNKYVSEATIREANVANNKKKGKYEKEKYQYLHKLFPEHSDTDHFKTNSHKIDKGSLITITSKIHGTSGRAICAAIPVKLNFFQKILNKLFFSNRLQTQYETIHGTRRVILTGNNVGSLYKNTFRSKVLEKIKPIIDKNYIFYYEIVGYMIGSKPIMNAVDISKTKDKELIKRFPNPMIYKYGCLQGECEVYIYRITTINPDGIMEELSWNRVKQLCKSKSIKHVPEIDSFIYDGNEKTLKEYIEYLTELKDVAEPLDHSHIREGICIRVDSPDGKSKIYKNKLFLFKLLESNLKDTGTEDIEEIEDLKKDVTSE